MAATALTPVAKGLEACVALPPGEGRHPGMVVMMEAYGITGHIRGVCLRLAEAGFVAMAPDILHGEIIPYDDAPRAMARIPTLKDAQVLAEMGACLDWLATHPRVSKDALGIIGVCMGGRYAFLANCRFPGRLQAAVSFYGGGIAPEAPGPDRFGRTPPIGEADKMQAPLFLGYGADDSGIPAAEHARIVTALSGARKRYSLNVYPGAGHAFLCEERANYAPAAAEQGWHDAIDFLQAHLA